MREKFLLFLSTIFIVGLSWHVSLNYNIAVFAPMFILIMFFSVNPFPINKSYVYIFLSFMFIFIFWSLLNITIYEKVDFFITDKFIKKAFFGLFVMAFIFLFYGKRKELLAKSIDYALMIIVSLWFMQFFVYYTTGEYIDLLEPLLGAERAQRYQAYFMQSALPIDFIRPTSIYIEPGTYAVNTFPLLALSYMTHQKITGLHKAILFSYLTSLSLFAMIIATLFIFSSELSKIKMEWSKKNIVLVFVFTLIVSIIVAYTQYRFVDQGGTEQIGYREIVIGYWLSLNSVDMLLGLGNGQMVFGSHVGSEAVIIEDASFMFKLLFEFGIFSLPYVLLLLYISRGGVAILYLFIILLTKVHYQIYIMWFYPAALYILWQSERYNVINQSNKKIGLKK